MAIRLHYLFIPVHSNLPPYKQADAFQGFPFQSEIYILMFFQCNELYLIYQGYVVSMTTYGYVKIWRILRHKTADNNEEPVVSPLQGIIGPWLADCSQIDIKESFKLLSTMGLNGVLCDQELR